MVEDELCEAYSHGNAQRSQNDSDENDHGDATKCLGRRQGTESRNWEKVISLKFGAQPYPPAQQDHPKIHAPDSTPP